MDVEVGGETRGRAHVGEPAATKCAWAQRCAASVNDSLTVRPKRSRARAPFSPRPRPRPAQWMTGPSLPCLIPNPAELATSCGRASCTAVGKLECAGVIGVSPITETAWESDICRVLPAIHSDACHMPPMLEPNAPGGRPRDARGFVPVIPRATITSNFKKPFVKY